MIIFSLIEYYGVKVFVLSYFFNPFMFFEWELVINSFFIFCCYFFLFFLFPYFMVWGNLGQPDGQLSWCRAPVWSP
jgi:hypothetical protein